MTLQETESPFRVSDLIAKLQTLPPDMLVFAQDAVENERHLCKNIFEYRTFGHASCACFVLGKGVPIPTKGHLYPISVADAT